MKLTTNDLLTKLDLFCKNRNIKSNMDIYFAILLIGSEKLSVRAAAENLEIEESELILALNKFNIHYASI